RGPRGLAAARRTATRSATTRGPRRCCSRRTLGYLRRVALENPRRRKLAELVADHVLRHVNGNELLAVVHGQRVPHHLRNDRRPARPRLDDLLLRAAIHHLDLLEERRVDEGTFLQ